MRFVVLLPCLLAAACALPQRLDRPPPAPAAAALPAAESAAPPETANDAAPVDPIAYAEAARQRRQQAQLARLREAAARIDRVEQTTNLDEQALGLLRAARVALARGEPAAALERLDRLDALLQDAIRRHRVQPGESLWAIAARPEVYGNGLLWPLIWWENRDEIPNPDRLLVGQILRIPKHPTVAQVAEAIREARQRLRRRVEIGPITTDAAATD